MRRYLIAVAIVPLLAVPAHALPTADVAAKPLRNGCAQLFTQKSFRHYAERVYERQHVARISERQVQTMMRCQHSPKAERKMRVARRTLKAARKLRLAIAALTPYGPCWGGRWAVPCDIIATESKGYWGAVNHEGSGAIGPYQFLGWPVPWPVRTAADRLAHHRMAARLWAQQRAGAACHWCY